MRIEGWRLMLRLGRRGIVLIKNCLVGVSFFIQILICLIVNSTFFFLSPIKRSYTERSRFAVGLVDEILKAAHTHCVSYYFQYAKTLQYPPPFTYLCNLELMSSISTLASMAPASSMTLLTALVTALATFLTLGGWFSESLSDS